MAVLQRVAPAVAHPTFHPAYMPPPRPAYQPPRVITREIVRNVYQPPRTIERDIYHTNTVYVNRGWSPEQRRTFEEGARRRRYEELMREGRMSAEVAAAQAQAYAAQQALQQQQLQAQQAILNPQSQQPATSPGSPAADLSPQQDAAAAPQDGGAGADADGAGNAHKPKHLLMFVGLAAVAGVAGYMMLKKKKGKKASHSSAE